MRHITLILIALASLTIVNTAHAGAIKLTHDIKVTANMFDVFAWEKIAKDDDQEACHQFVSEHAMTTIPAGSEIFLDTNAMFDYVSVRVKGSSTLYYIPSHKTDQTLVD
jgi:hypothetical protein